MAIKELFHDLWNANKKSYDWYVSLLYLLLAIVQPVSRFWMVFFACWALLQAMSCNMFRLFLSKTEEILRTLTELMATANRQSAAAINSRTKFDA